ncbi:MAG: threonine/serine exporter family protein [Ruminococcaceae bacterium]|nr:threonine/serine exporter family protein [Oscillospiraceae bacterium]
MDLKKLLDMGLELGYRLQVSGAETYRVEESINRLMQAYDVDCETFAVPNSLIVSIRDENGEVITGLRRIGYHGTNIDAVERCNTICRKIEREKPDLETAQQMLSDEYKKIRTYPLLISLLGYFLASAGFAVFFGANLPEALFAGISGVACGLSLQFMTWLHANDFFQIIMGGFVIAFTTQTFAITGLIQRADAASIGALMVLVPGLGITNTMRDIIFGDTQSGINRLVQVCISAAAIGIGTGSALLVCRAIYGTAEVSLTSMPDSAIAQCISAFIASIGFCLLYNARTFGMCFCALGGVPGWLTYLLCVDLGLGDYIAAFAGAAVVSLYAEIMARVRKFPATSYLTTSLLPLVPGASIYYTAVHLLNNDPDAFAARVMYIIGYAGALAVGVLLVSSGYRMFSTWKWFRKLERLGKARK